MEDFDVFRGRVRRLGVIMEPDTADPREVEGVLNPAAMRATNGQLYLLPRMVAAGNYSRIGLARVIFNRRGYPVGVERLGVVLEPREPYEINARTGGGIEDPRVVYIAARRYYVMLYTAYGPAGPRIAGAVSRDLIGWRRTGLVRFAPHHGIDIDALHNKDALLFPEPVPGPDGRLALALIHRPTLGDAPTARGGLESPEHEGHRRPSMWISYAPVEDLLTRRHIVFGQHHLLAPPQQPWERLKVGGGTPPLRLSDGWLVFYHGVSGQVVEGIDQQQRVRYSAGALLLELRDPRRVLCRSTRSVLVPRVATERTGIVPRVVFPTGIDPRGDGTLDIYYGMADSRIGAARWSLASQRAYSEVRAA
jgi:beta-1,2-mannobiose phosphorylase / 1,2-beta-oligomannan phosphorylase